MSKMPTVGYSNNPGFKRIAEVAQSDRTPSRIAASIRKIAAEYEHNAYAGYGNRVLRWLEQRNGLTEGKLGKARSARQLDKAA